MDNLFTPPLRADDREQALVTITSAFAHDPVERWLYPDDNQYRQHFPEFAAALGGGSFEQQTAWASSEGTAVALWLPPGAETDDTSIVEILTNTVPPAITGPAPSSEPPLAAAPFTVVKLFSVSISHSSLPSAVA